MEELLERCLAALQGTDRIGWQEWTLSLTTTFLGAVIGAGAAIVVMLRTLSSQRRENARARMHDVVAAILGNIFDLAGVIHRTPGHRPHNEVQAELSINQERLHLDLGEDKDCDIYHALSAAINIIDDEIERSPEEATPKTEAGLEGAFHLLAELGSILAEWTRAGTIERKKHSDHLIQIIWLIDKRGLDAWLKISKSTATQVNWRDRLFRDIDKG